MILEPLLVVPAASSKETATFMAVPTHLAALNPDFTGHGSGYRSSKIEFRANSHSLTGTKNLFRAEFSPFPNGSAVNVRPN
jgi:hypothetical protein